MFVFLNLFCIPLILKIFLQGGFTVVAVRRKQDQLEPIVAQINQSGIFKMNLIKVNHISYLQNYLDIVWVLVVMLEKRRM